MVDWSFHIKPQLDFFLRALRSFLIITECISERCLLNISTKNSNKFLIKISISAEAPAEGGQAFTSDSLGSLVMVFCFTSTKNFKYFGEILKTNKIPTHSPVALQGFNWGVTNSILVLEIIISERFLTTWEKSGRNSYRASSNLMFRKLLCKQYII